MVEENPEVVASITEGGDFKKPSEKSAKKTNTGNKSEDKKVEEVESASGEKVVRAAHVPVPSQVSFFLRSKIESGELSGAGRLLIWNPPWSIYPRV